MGNVYRVSDEIPKTLCMIETKRLDPADFVASPSICTCNISPNRNVFGIHAQSLISIVHLVPSCYEEHKLSMMKIKYRIR